YHNALRLTPRCLKSRGAWYAWTQAPCSAPLGGGAPRAPYADPCPQDAPQHLSFRAHVILSLAEGLTAPEVARHLGTTRTTVRRWRRHWLTRPGCAVSERLQDAPRPGAP